MLMKRNFGIELSEGLAKAIFTNDWMHSILVRDNAPVSYRNLAKVLIGSQIGVSSAALFYNQSHDVSRILTRYNVTIANDAHSQFNHGRSLLSHGSQQRH